MKVKLISLVELGPGIWGVWDPYLTDFLPSLLTHKGAWRYSWSTMFYKCQFSRLALYLYFLISFILFWSLYSYDVHEKIEAKLFIVIYSKSLKEGFHFSLNPRLSPLCCTCSSTLWSCKGCGLGYFQAQDCICFPGVEWTLPSSWWPG